MALERISRDLLDWLETSTRASLARQGESTDFVEALENAPITGALPDMEHYRGNIYLSSGYAISREEIDRRFGQSFLKDTED